MSDSLTPQFVAVMERHKVLPPDKQQELCMRAQNADMRARDLLINHNLRLIVKKANKYRRYSGDLDLEDLVAEGTLGLISAIRGFDPSKETVFSTYAFRWIESAMQRAIINSGSTIRLPVSIASLRSKVYKTAFEIEAVTGEWPTNEAIAERAELKVEEVEKIFEVEKTKQIASLDSPVTEEDEKEVYEKIPDHAPSAYELTVKKMDAEEIRSKMEAQLPKRFKRIVEMRYGFEDDVQMTLEAIGAEYKISAERVNQILGKSLKALAEGYVIEEWVEPEKQCNRCFEWKTLNQFHTRIKDGKKRKQPYCIDCKKEIDQKYNKRKVERRRERKLEQ